MASCVSIKAAHAARPSSQDEAQAAIETRRRPPLEEQQRKALQSGIWRGVRPGTALTSSGCSDSGSYRKQTPLTPAVVRRRIGALGLLSAPPESHEREANGCERWEGAGLSLHDSARSRRAGAERLCLRRPSPTRRRWDAVPLVGGRREVFILEDVPG
jgi:hypothetical protein